MTTIISVALHASIVLAYVALGTWLLPRVVLLVSGDDPVAYPWHPRSIPVIRSLHRLLNDPASSRSRLRLFGMMFFLGCAYTHFEFIVHATSGLSAMEMTRVDHLLPHALQAVGALMFVRESVRALASKRKSERARKELLATLLVFRDDLLDAAGETP